MHNRFDRIRRPLCVIIALLLLAATAPAYATSETVTFPRPSPPSVPSTAPHALFPPLNETGFLDEGEFLHKDEEQGIWLYVSRDLRVEILRKLDEAIPLVWYEADIWTAGDQHPFMLSASGSWKTLTYAEPDAIARNAGAVFAISADYFQYRVNRKLRVGVIIRNGAVLYDDTLKSGAERFPNLDTLAILPGGEMRVFNTTELEAQAYLDMGATDVLSFGPWLVRGGKINPALENRVSSPQPRLGLGMVTPGHYVCILTEGRLAKISVGAYLPTLAQLLQDKGCVEALNLDGGQTAVINFMGEQLNRIGTYTAQGGNSPRAATELLVIGTSERVAPVF